MSASASSSPILTSVDIDASLSRLTLAPPANSTPEQRLAYVEERESELRKTEKKIAKKLRQLKETEERVREATARWEEMERRMQVNALRVPALVNLNVGGQLFTTTKDTLLHHKGSYFEAMLLSTFSQQDRNGYYFIDYDPTYFGLVLEFLREGKFDAIQLKTYDPDKLHQAFKFFNVDITFFKRRRLTNSACPEDEEGTQEARRLFDGEGTLLRVYHMKKIALWLPQKRFSLLYKATRDGFGARDFHSKCDNKGATLVVIQNEDGFLFGGYTACSWHGNNIYRADHTAFLFTLSNPHSISPCIFPIKPDEVQHAVACNTSACATFGSGPDLFLAPNSNTNRESRCIFPWSYSTTTSQGSTTFTGNSDFMTFEVEVYAVLPVS